MITETCIFCKKSPPEIKLTSEHILPKWMIKKIKHKKDVFFRGNHRNDPFEILEDETIRNMPGASPFSQTVNDVCCDCNNKWLSALETKAQPILEKLINGSNHILTRKEAHIISLWAIKTAITRSLIEKGINTIPSSHIEAIYNGLIPDNTRVYLGCYPNKVRYLTRHQRVGTKYFGNMYITTFCINSLFLQVIGSESKELYDSYDPNFLEDINVSSGKILCIHPLKHGAFEWPFHEKIKIDAQVLSGLIGDKFFNMPLLYEDNYLPEDGLYMFDLVDKKK